MATDQIEFSEVFEFRDGLLFWKPRPEASFKTRRGWSIWNAQNAGRLAGTIRANGYVVVSVKKRLLLAHRVVFAMHHGFMPEEIDHINGDRGDNRIENLRAASCTQNRRNSVSKAGASGVKGVCWKRDKGKWRARVSGRHLGYFSSKECAEGAVVAARSEMHGEFANHECR
jgi:hypothetical protein